jgi:DNA polymerase-3 subunit alpha
MPNFNHLHVHTQYSLLDGAASISDLAKKAKEDGMKALAITDHGNMFGAFKFHQEVKKAGIKPIIGCEFYLVEDRTKKEFSKGDKDNRFHQLFLAKNEIGYKNLSKLCSLGYIEGMYSKYPRIDKSLVPEYHEGLIATSCCIGAEIPQALLNGEDSKAEELLKWWLDIFGEDYYIELQRHKLTNIDGTGRSQEDINQSLLKLAQKYNVKTIATNDSHYVNKEDYEAHDILLCVNTGELKSTPKGNGKGYRFGFPNDEFYFKTQKEMGELFTDVPQALDYTNEIADKVEDFELKRNILMPEYPIPQEFKDADDYLRHLTMEGAKIRYKVLTKEIDDRINTELEIIKNMGFAGYFLIVQDYIREGKNMGVAVGPGRGSAAGSVVAYCTGITNIDPIRYKLLFERFLNPERKSMPDIDVDFDDKGREEVINFVVEKYGDRQVAQIITMGTMAAKSAIKDAARVLDLPLAEANALAKLVDLQVDKDKSVFQTVEELVAIKKESSRKGEVIRMAEKLEGSVRNTGIHAAGVIIAPRDITEFIPVSKSKESNLWVTQFDGKYIESAGMLKMDFLGLKTLTIIRDALELIKQRQNITINIDEIPLDDPKTFELYQKGNTIGTFQFESAGMRKSLKELQPTSIDELIAMNALYRPGPMDYIPTFIKRKHGQEEIVYPHPLLEQILGDTYGIMVYQEQIMQAAQIIAGYSLGGADLLRRAMGKKDEKEMERQRSVFVEGAEKHINLVKDSAIKIFDIIKKFAEYGFNRSHSAAYSVLAYQTGYLKANYPEEYMASVLSHNMKSLEKLEFFMNECSAMGIKVLGPDINESGKDFNVTQAGNIRFGLTAIRGIGEGPVEAILTERAMNGMFADIFDFTARIQNRSINKKALETLALAGAFDSWGHNRASYVMLQPNDDMSAIDKALKYGQSAKAMNTSSGSSLFGEEDLSKPTKYEIQEMEEYPLLEKLNFEKDYISLYLSGHPLDEYRFEVAQFTNINLADIDNAKPNVEFTFGGIISKADHLKSQKGKEYGRFTIEDFNHNKEVVLFGSTYLKFKHFMVVGKTLLVTGVRKTSYRNPEELELNVTNMMLIDEAYEQYGKTLIIQLELSEINKELIEQIKGLLKKYKGKQDCYVLVQKGDENLKMKLGSAKVNITKDLIDELKKFVYGASLSHNLSIVSFRDILDETKDEMAFEDEKEEEFEID